MTVHAPLKMTKEAFLAWVGRRDERYEYAGGRVIMMVNVTLNHSRVTGNLIFALRSRLKSEDYHVAPEGLAVHVGDHVRFPDVLVEPARAEGNVLGAKAPVLIAEVLSPGSLHLDFGDKPREYLALPSLDTYLVISSDEPRVWVWQRVEGQFPKEPEIIEGAAMEFALPALAINVPLSELYIGVR
jgi:Uma2 family endonuclease